MLKPLYRSTPVDGTVAADALISVPYVGGCPGGIGANGIYGTLVDANYCGVLVNASTVDIANGKAAFYAGVVKVAMWRGVTGTDPEVDAFCPFDITTAWAIGSQLYIRNMGAYAIWSSVNYDGGFSHGFVTKAPASASDTLEGWFIERRIS